MLNTLQQPATLAGMRPNMLSPMKPGIYTALDAEVYHKCFAASASCLKTLASDTPAHLREKLDNPTEATKALAFGTAVHAAVLEPAKYAKTFMPARQCEATTGKGAQCSKTGSARFGGHWLCGTHEACGEPDPITVLSPDDFEAIEAIRQSLLNHEMARYLLTGPGGTEVSAFWECPDTGVICKGRADRIVRDGQFSAIVDLKTCECAAPREFVNQIASLNYHVQAAHYLHGWAALGAMVEKFIFIAVEKKPPYAVAVYEIGDGIVEAGRRRGVELLNVWKECAETDIWPAYSGDIIKVATLPAWANRIEQPIERA